MSYSIEYRLIQQSLYQGIILFYHTGWDFCTNLFAKKQKAHWAYIYFFTEPHRQEGNIQRNTKMSFAPGSLFSMTNVNSLEPALPKSVQQGACSLSEVRDRAPSHTQKNQIGVVPKANKETSTSLRPEQARSQTCQQRAPLRTAHAWSDPKGRGGYKLCSACRDCSRANSLSFWWSKIDFTKVEKHFFNV